MANLNNPYPGTIPLSKDYRKLQSGVLKLKTEQLVVDSSDNNPEGDNLTLAEQVALINSTIGFPYTPYEEGGTITAELAEALALIKGQGMAQKLAAVASREDAIYETLQNKSLLEPTINETSEAQASVTIPLADTDGVITITQIQPGDSGNIKTLRVDVGESPAAVVVAYAAPQIIVGAGSDSTCYEVARALLEDADISALFAVSYEAADAGKLVEAVADGTPFTGGVTGHVLLSTGTQIDAAIAQAPVSGAPVPPVASSAILKVSAEPAEGATVSIGGTTYKSRRSALGAGVKAACVLDLTAEAPHDGDFATLGSLTYTFKTALTPTAGEVLIEATSADSVRNLVAAVSGGAGAGTKYATGTTASTDITVAADGNTMTVEYNTVGFIGNSFATLTGNGEGAMTHGSFHTAALHGGIDAQAANDIYTGGTAEIFIDNLVLAITDTTNRAANIAAGKYGTGTVVHTLVTASKKDGDEMNCAAITAGVVGDDIAIAVADDNLAWDETEFLSGGVDGTPAPTGAIRYEASKLWISVGISTTAVSNWKYADLT